MLRIRKTDGTAEEIREDLKFVEVCDDMGRIAVLIFRDSAGKIKVVQHNDPEAEKYRRLFKNQQIEFCPVVGLKR